MCFPGSLVRPPEGVYREVRSPVRTGPERLQPGPSTRAWRSPLWLVGTEDALLQQLADSMLKEDCASELKVHLARSLPLPSNVNRPRIDLIVFVVNLHSKYSLRNVEESLHHVDATFFLGKVGFLITGGSGDRAICPWTLGYPPPPGLCPLLQPEVARHHADPTTALCAQSPAGLPGALSQSPSSLTGS
uniref:centromere protein M isoform X2 n=2 Tax=Halichoerus grypus TaxID=9711 RepID=UPI00165981F5|nr:centromere protein M isoform X2 [Halichoerus grypus]